MYRRRNTGQTQCCNGICAGTSFHQSATDTDGVATVLSGSLVSRGFSGAVGLCCNRIEAAAETVV